MTERLWTDLPAVPFLQRYYDVNGVRARVLEADAPGAPALLLLYGVNGHAETYVRNIGAADPIAGVDVGHWCRDQIEGSLFVLMEYSGHWPQFGEPYLFNRAYIEFLSGRRARGRA